MRSLSYAPSTGFGYRLHIKANQQAVVATSNFVGFICLNRKLHIRTRGVQRMQLNHALHTLLRQTLNRQGDLEVETGFEPVIISSFGFPARPVGLYYAGALPHLSYPLKSFPRVLPCTQPKLGLTLVWNWTLNPVPRGKLDFYVKKRPYPRCF